MTFWHTLVFGIVEGLTEFLPVSSTGHLILTAHILKLEQTEFMKTFQIAIQLGAILSVLAVYWRSFFVQTEILKRVLAAFIPTAVIGLALYQVVKSVLMAHEEIVLISLIAGGVVLILFDRLFPKSESASTDLSKISYKKAVGIGVIQALSIIPGVSRAAATILGGSVLGFDRKSIVEFSFLLAVPTIAAATGLDLLKNGVHFDPHKFTLLLCGGAVSFVVAYLAIRYFIRFVQHHGFTVFGVYRIFAAALYWFFVK